MATTPSPHLLFKLPPATGGQLVFGAGDEPSPPALATGTLQASIAPPSASASGSATTVAHGTLQASAAAPSATASGAAQYNSLTERPTVTAAVAHHQVASALAALVQAQHGITTRQPAVVLTRYHNASPAQHSTAARNQNGTDIRRATGTSHAQASTAQTSAGLSHQDGTDTRQATSTRHAESTSAQRGAAMPHQDGTPIWHARTARHQQATQASTSRHPRHQIATARRAHWHTRHQDGRTAPAGMPQWPQPPGPPGYVSSPHLLFACPPATSGLLVFGRTCAYLPAQTTIPIRRAYVTINRIELINLDNAATLPATDFALDIDADSWTWSWSATLHSSAAALVQPYDELQATINNVPYRLAVGEIGRSKQFPTDRLKISGRGIAQELTDPQAPVTTYGADTERTAQQLMADVLTVNGVPLGWAIDWQITDWLVPANAWTIQGTAMQALIDIASAAGAYIQPHPTARTLRVLPRYPLPPWEWSASAPALELPAAVCATESTQMVIRPAYNRVFVGGTSAGVFGPVTRSGTAGDVLAPQITHPLITDAAVHRQRGIAELANTGRQTHMTLSLPVLPATGLILPGTMVRHRDGSRTHTGIVRSTGVRWASPAMRQTIGLECHELA